MSEIRYWQEIHLELLMLDRVASQLASLHHDARQESTFGERDILATVTVLMNLYNGMENILKRTCRFRDVPLPKGENTHSELVRRFTGKGEFASVLPHFVPESLQQPMNQLRKFRHVIMHGYAFTLEKSRIIVALQEAPALYAGFKAEVERFLAALPPEKL
jgi:hypothetical protein